ncbi:MAG: putative sulfate/molybdate transporter [Proteobacteria bacterium]|nr:putative sulfate/molybdate transporter [Pseudomonadota bacterium]
MSRRFEFNRMEVAGSLGDLGTLLPLAMGMILINHLDPTGVLLSIGVFYVLAGAYYGVTVPVQPMKVIGAYAVATGIGATQIMAAGLWLAVFLLIIGLTGAVTVLGRYTPLAVVRGVQLSTGVLLMAQGVRLMVGTSQFQVLAKAAEPNLIVQSLGPVPIGIVIGLGAAILTLLLLDNRRLPAGLVVVILGLILGLVLGRPENLARLSLGLNLPRILPFGWPSWPDFTLALLVLALPQAPMTLGNAVIANADLSQEYFGEKSRRVTYRSLCITQGLANVMAFFLGGMPMCHGAGGLAAHYRFGARTAGSNLIIGAVFIVLALGLGSGAVAVLRLMPMAVLGVLLLFAGAQLALSVIDLGPRRDWFVALVMLGLTLATNLAIAFGVGLGVAWLLKWDKLNV